jgi:hypothetical protein
VHDRELGEASGTQRLRDRRQCPFGVGDVHQAHERGDDIETGRPKGQPRAVADHMADAPPVLLGRGPHERFGDVESDHAGSAVGEQSGVVALTTTDVEAPQAIDGR